MTLPHPAQVLVAFMNSPPAKTALTPVRSLHADEQPASWRRRISPELSVILSPQKTLALLAQEQEADENSFSLLWRGPVFFAFVFGCVVSLTTGGRLSARLILGGMISFSIV